MGLQPAQPILLKDFQHHRPRFEVSQVQSLELVARLHSDHDEDFERMHKLFRRFGCGPEKISNRGTVLEDVKLLRKLPTSKRNQIFAETAEAHVAALFKDTDRVPHHILHVSCTGYISPSAVQALVRNRGWNQKTEVTHLYHMGCYAALPAVRVAWRMAQANADLRVEIVHNEMCTLHLDAANHSPEQMVIQSLFGDGSIRYQLCTDISSKEPGLEVLAIQEEILAETENFMSWRLGDSGMNMTLSREVPHAIDVAIEGFVKRMLSSQGYNYDLSTWLGAIHPGGPRIIETVSTRLGLTQDQVRHSTNILFRYGNMSSATLPHVWESLLNDSSVAPGQLILSLAFGPGLTVFGAILRKR